MTVTDPSVDMSQPGMAVPSGRDRDAAMLGHDIRGALQGVLAGLGQLEAAGLSGAAREQVDRAAASAKALAWLVGALLGGEPDRAAAARHSRVDLDRFLRHVQRRFGAEARERGIRLEVARGPGLPAVLRLDLVPLTRVVCNLVGNALKFAGSGTVRLTAGRAVDGGIEFRVADQGPGLTREVEDGLVRIGHRPDGAGRPASGLGLQIARSLTERLGGTFTVRNAAGGGVEAVLRLPAGVAPADDPGRPGAVRIDLAGLRVLLAEDNPTNQMVATQMLKALNAEVTVSADGVEALERFEQQPFDLVVVDIEMPRLSGLDVIRAIRARGDARAGVPIVALTAYAMREHRERISEAGANGLISKPITSVEALGRALAAHAAPRLAEEPAPAPAPVAEAAAGPVVDVAVFAALADAIGAEMMAELLDKVISDLLDARRDLAGALEPLDRGPIRTASHILISVAGALGATRLHACARTLNTAAHAEPADGLDAGVRHCLDEIDAAVAFARAKRGAS